MIKSTNEHIFFFFSRSQNRQFDLESREKSCEKLPLRKEVNKAIAAIFAAKHIFLPVPLVNSQIHWGNL